MTNNGTKASTVALLEKRKAVCTVTLTNKQSQPIVLHRVIIHPHNTTITSPLGVKSEHILSLLPMRTKQQHQASDGESTAIILHAGDTWTNHFTFKAPEACAGVDHCVDSCDPLNASQVAAVACHWTRLCDDPSAIQKRDFNIALGTTLLCDTAMSGSAGDAVVRWQPSKVVLEATTKAIEMLTASISSEANTIHSVKKDKIENCDQILSKHMDHESACIRLPPTSLLSTLLKHTPRVQAVRVPFSVKFNKPVMSFLLK